ncbi:MAG: hypothetical protein WKF86_08465 [Acidimicrobiales bacterium]
MSSSTADQWVYVVAPLFAYGIIVLGLAAWGWVHGGSGHNPLSIFFRSISLALNRLMGLPGWCMAGGLTGLTAAGIAAVGVYWDVAWHIDNGRDKELFTPSHTMILIGLNGLVFAAAVAIIFATLDQLPAAGRSRLRVPRSAVLLGALGLGASAAFPLDDLWHKAYGVDVTLWSPTHLQLIAGGSLSPIAIWLMIREGRREKGSVPTGLARAIEVLTFGAILTGLSIVQGEFDFGVPQFQVLYQPILIAAAAGLALVAARITLGRGGALGAVLAFLVLRGTFALLVGGALNHTVPRFPLYVLAAVAVEVVALVLGTNERLRFAAVSGLAVGTVGVAAELAWIELSGWGSPRLNGLPVAVVLTLVAAVAVAELGAALVQGNVRPEHGAAKARAAVVVAAGLALIVVLAIPLPRNVGEVEAVISLDRLDGESTVRVQLEPASAAEDATMFGVIAWQGGGRVLAELDEVGPGRYVSSQSVPVGGTWKSMVGLQRGDEVMAAPIYLPADPEIGASAVPAQTERRVPFSLNTDILLREGKDGPAWPALAAYAGVALVLALWLALFTRAASGVRPPSRSPTRAEALDVHLDGRRPTLAR